MMMAGTFKDCECGSGLVNLRAGLKIVFVFPAKISRCLCDALVNLRHIHRYFFATRKGQNVEAKFLSVGHVLTNKVGNDVTVSASFFKVDARMQIDPIGSCPMMIVPAFLEALVQRLNSLSRKCVASLDSVFRDDTNEVKASFDLMNGFRIFCASSHDVCLTNKEILRVCSRRFDASDGQDDPADQFVHGVWSLKNAERPTVRALIQKFLDLRIFPVKHRKWIYFFKRDPV